MSLMDDVGRGQITPPLGERVGSYIAFIARGCIGCIRKGQPCKTCLVEPAAGLVREIALAGGVPGLTVAPADFVVLRLTSAPAPAAPAAAPAARPCQAAPDPAPAAGPAAQPYQDEQTAKAEAHALIARLNAERIAKGQAHKRDVQKARAAILAALSPDTWTRRGAIPALRGKKTLSSDLSELVRFGLVEIAHLTSHTCMYRLARAQPAEVAS